MQKNPGDDRAKSKVRHVKRSLLIAHIGPVRRPDLGSGGYRFRIILVAASGPVKHLLLKCSADHLIFFITGSLDIHHVVADHI